MYINTLFRSIFIILNIFCPKQEFWVYIYHDTFLPLHTYNPRIQKHFIMVIPRLRVLLLHFYLSLFRDEAQFFNALFNKLSWKKSKYIYKKHPPTNERGVNIVTPVPSAISHGSAQYLTCGFPNTADLMDPIPLQPLQKALSSSWKANNTGGGYWGDEWRMGNKWGCQYSQ